MPVPRFAVVSFLAVDRRWLPVVLASLLLAAAPLLAQRNRAGQTDVPVTRLAAPTGLFVSWSNGSAVLAWQPVPGAAGYVVDHATSPTGPWARLTRMPI